MKLLIASDIHGSAHYLRLLLTRFREEGAEKMLLLGDLLYHGARNPLPPEYDTLKCAELLNGVRGHLLCVRGNCDSDVDQTVLDFPITAAYCFFPAGKRTAVATHGHFMPAALNKGDVLFNGHFHVPAIEEREDYTYVNCGSVSIPKENSPHSYLILEENRLVWKDVETGEPFMRAEL